MSETRESGAAGRAEAVPDQARGAGAAPGVPRGGRPAGPPPPRTGPEGSPAGGPEQPPVTVWPGSPQPLGARFRTGPDGRVGTNFALWAGGAESVEVCLFADDGTESRAPLTELTHEVWHGFLPGVRPGRRYGFRVGGRWDPWTGARWNPAKLLLDPYARAVDGSFAMVPEVYGHVRDWPEPEVADTVRDDRDSAPFVPKGVVVDDDDDWRDDRRPKTPWSDTVIYELHVRGFTMRHPEIPPELRGTYAGLAHPAAIAHLTRLGVTAVELLPVHQFADEEHLERRGLRNYWGYNSIGYFAPHAGYSAGGSRGQQVGEFKRMVRALHAAGIEVILDVVYNHTAEGGQGGPTLSLRGIDNRGYYRLRGRPARLHRLHRLRQHAHGRAAARAAADHGLAALLGDRDGRGRLPVRPRGGAGPLDARRGHALPVPGRDRPGPGAAPGQAHRRAVGRRRRRLPGGRLPAAVDGVERPFPRHRAGLLARRRRATCATSATGCRGPATCTTGAAGARTPPSTSSPRTTASRCATSSATTPSTTRPTARTAGTAPTTTGPGTAGPRARPTTGACGRCAGGRRGTCWRRCCWRPGCRCWWPATRWAAPRAATTTPTARTTRPVGWTGRCWTIRAGARCAT